LPAFNAVSIRLFSGCGGCGVLAFLFVSVWGVSVRCGAIGWWWWLGLCVVCFGYCYMVG